MLIAEFHNVGGAPVYPGGINLETDYKVWGRNVVVVRSSDGNMMPFYYPEIRSDEEWAVAGLLWDLHDSGQETHTLHKAGINEDLSDLWVELSEVYHTTADRIALFDGHILGNIRSDKPKNLVDLYSAFLGDVSASDLDMIFINHGAFGDVDSRNLIHNVTEAIGATGSTSEPARPGRMSPQPSLPGSYFATERNATFAVNIVHEEPYSNYDYSYRVDMTVDQPRYFEMPPPYYPSRAVFDQISPDGKILNANVLTFNSSEYWSYIDSNPEADALFKTLPVSESPPEIPDSGEPAPQLPAQPSGCLIATAAFGSELAPQVQFLRGFRDNHILTTASGSSFMNVFNAWYYSFSPQVADYEREQPWLQQGVRVAIYPLLGILQAAEKAYTVVPGEYGSLAAGLVASSLIGAVYFSPVAISIKQVRKNRLNYRIAIAIIAALLISVAAALAANNDLALMVATAMLVLSTLSFAAIYSAKAIWKIFQFYKKQKDLAP
jgi:peptide/nickel transport system substrate-binding protein